MFGRMTRDDILARCEQASLPFAPIARPEDLFDDPAAQCRQQPGVGHDVSMARRPTLPRLPLRFLATMPWHCARKSALKWPTHTRNPV